MEDYGVYSCFILMRSKRHSYKYHGYFGVDVENVWEVTQKDLPFLKEQIGKMLDDF